MLEDLSQHVLDIAENSIAAKAQNILVEIKESQEANILSMTVEDDGSGMSEDLLKRVADPFVTSRTTRRVGMGIPFLKQSAELCDGSFRLESKVGVGTCIEAVFAYDSIDRPPVGNMASTMMTLFMGHPDINWTYRHHIGNETFSLTTAELVEVLEDRELLRTTEIGLWIRDQITESLDALRSSSQTT